MGKGINFRPINVSDSEMVLNWRTSPRVTQYMNTDIEYDVDAQTEWIKSLKTRFDYYVWIIQLNEIPLGVINISDIDYDNLSCSWGYYIGRDEYLGYGGFVPPYVYNFVFNSLNLAVLNIKVFSENISVINLHLKYGYELNPFYDEIIFKNNIQINLLGMSLHVNKWNFGRYNKFISNLKLEK
jgi:UDP-4-amino-4,6-dideoxy-N-acetyl-beta-L-altrosamine N-acetyltransferase